MKMSRRYWLMMLAGFILATSLAFAAAEATKPRVTDSQAKEAAKALAKITGIAISPLLGVGVVGGYDWFCAETPEEKAKLPWYAQVKFWLPALLLVAAVAIKDGAGAALPPGWKKPLDVCETVESKISGLVAAGAVVPSVAMIFGTTLQSAMGDSSGPVVQQAGLLGFSLAPLMNVLMIPLAVTCFVLVWLVGHVTNVLILISPWGAVDAALKGFRTAAISILTGVSVVDPKAGAVLSVLIIIVAYFIAGWSFRLMWFGGVFTWDFITFRRKRFQPAANDNWMFTARQLEKTPIRSYGKLHKDEAGRLTFVYKPWLFLPERKLAVPDVKLAVGRGLFYPEIMALEVEKTKSLFLLPPRYKKHEDEIAGIYGIQEVRDVGLLKGLKAIWNWVTGKSVAQPAVAPA